MLNITFFNLKAVNKADLVSSKQSNNSFDCYKKEDDKCGLL